MSTEGAGVVPDPDTEQCLAGHHAANIIAVAWQPNNTRLIASGGADGHVVICDVDTKQQVRRIGVSGPVLALDFNPVRHNMLAVACMNGSVSIIDVENASQVYVADLHDKKHVTRARWSPDGLLLATAGLDKTICLSKEEGRDGSWGTVKQVFLTATPESLTWLPSSSTLVYSIRDSHELHMYDGAAMAVRQRLSLNTHGDEHVSFACIDLCAANGFPGLMMATTDRNRAVVVHPSTVGPLFALYGAVNDEYSTPRTSFSPNDAVVYSTSQDASIVTWELRSRRAVGQLRRHRKQIVRQTVRRLSSGF